MVPITCGIDSSESVPVAVAHSAWNKDKYLLYSCKENNVRIFKTRFKIKKKKIVSD